jgi:hypothetical protein
MLNPMRVLTILLVACCTTVAMAAPDAGSAMVDEPSAVGLMVTGVIALYLLRRRQNIG